MAEEANLNEMLKMRREKLQNLVEMGKNPFEIEKYDVTHKSQYIKENFEELEGKTVSIAGRLMAKRGHGKAGFADLQDSEGRIQLFVKMNLIGEEEYELYKTYDIGDIIGVKGEIFKTKMGEISVKAKEIVLLSKSLQILPEKFHGLKDPDLRYRQRYVDLIMNPEVKDTFITRSNIIKAIREFLDNRDFMEVETPVLSTLAGGASARPFITHHNALDIDMYLRISLELPLKRLIVGGFDRVYEMSRVFRNEGMDSSHNPEFTLLELYQAYADYEDMMELVESLYSYVAEKVKGTTKITYQGQEIDLTPPWPRIRMVDAVKEHTGVDFDKITDIEEARREAEKLGLELEGNESIGEIISEAFDEYVEDKLIQPVFITHHPVEISPLAKKDPEDPRYTHRFEPFICGSEAGNAFSELNDPIDQKERFLEQVKKREAGDDEAHMMDYDFINALEVGLPPTGGLGIGIDRLVMLFTDESSIRDVILFPTMKPVDNK
ncbi:lysine--tRNA ligase [Caldisalinibacter kiritimatiensis]|uniref:Lysine--tRNA ligase n=1 Tax=Caldisalinibacter kiritimatiensis TaxID=1304284 RepID=R1CBT0_9FIRM|nr:lysine--tRNA ligase [Caldisalinibacter kiritimatiensis]EOC99774.1 Lysyl-tRNA synthetase (class II) [Caldisalinibacter kiritimatiensis]